MTDKPSEAISGLDRLRSGAEQLMKSGRGAPETEAEREQRIRNSGNPLLQTSASYAAERQRIREQREENYERYGTTDPRAAAAATSAQRGPDNSAFFNGGRATPTYSQQDKIDTCRAIERDQGGKPYAPCDKILRGNKKGPGMS